MQIEFVQAENIRNGYFLSVQSGSNEMKSIKWPQVSITHFTVSINYFR